MLLAYKGNTLSWCFSRSDTHSQDFKVNTEDPSFRTHIDSVTGEIPPHKATSSISVLQKRLGLRACLARGTLKTAHACSYARNGNYLRGMLAFILCTAVFP